MCPPGRSGLSRAASPKSASRVGEGRRSRFSRWQEARRHKPQQISAATIRDVVLANLRDVILLENPLYRGRLTLKYVVQLGS